MGAVFDFEKEKLIIGVIYHDKQVLDEVMEILTKEFGETDDCSEEFSFSNEFSNYYDDEIGGEGLRRIYSFKKLYSVPCSRFAFHMVHIIVS